jgi:hypothetical protein
MILRYIGWELALITVFCVTAIFFFPAVQGPYSAVNGPATAFQAAKAAARLKTAVVQAALSSCGSFRIPSLLRTSCASVWYPKSHSASFADCITIRRC